MTFMQIFEVSTAHPDQVLQLVEDWAAKTEGRRTVHRSTFAADRDRPGTYIQIVEFPS